MNKIRHFSNFEAFIAYMQYPPPEHPLLSVVPLSKGNYCGLESSKPFTNECYSIVLKKVVSGKITYGRTKYDFSNGAMLFTAPGQILQWDGVLAEQEGFVILFHQDFILNSSLYRQIKRYAYFSYSANEALHLSVKEQKIIESIFINILLEYQNNQDQFSKDIILSHIATLLKYADRFYQRQFINRKDLSGILIDRFRVLLEDYFDTDKAQEKGLPKIEMLAEQLNVSQRYLSDTLKKETGKTPIEHLHLFLIQKAKDLLLQPNKTISEVAYELGFEYQQYFSRLFKKKTGISPTAYQESYMKPE